MIVVPELIKIYGARDLAALRARSIKLDTSDPAAYFKRIDTLRVGFFSTIARLWSADFNRELKNLYGATSDFKNVIAWRNAVEAEIDNHYDMTSTYEKTYAAIWPVFAERVYDALTGSKAAGSGFELKADPEKVDEWLARAIAWIRAEGGDLIKTVSANKKTRVIMIVRAFTEEAVSNGWSISRLQGEVEKRVRELQDWEVRRIARTETMRASNLGSRAGAKATGLKLNKEWLTGPSGTGDRHATADYIGLALQTRAMDEEYVINGPNGIFTCQYPCDIVLPPEESINCRCSESYVPA